MGEKKKEKKTSNISICQKYIADYFNSKYKKPVVPYLEYKSLSLI